MKKGMEYSAYVEKVDFPNKGICVIVSEDASAEEREFRFVVKGALPGQTILFRITKLYPAKHRGEGLLLSVEQPASQEITDVCAFASQCGGCTYQSLSYECQVALKEEQVRSLMDAVISEPYEFLPIKKSPMIKRYRNKMEFSFGDEYKGGPLSLGLHKRGSFYDILTTNTCELVHEDVNRILFAVLEIAKASGQMHYHKVTHIGYFRHFVVRRAEKTGEILLNLVTADAAPSFDETAFLKGFCETVLSLSLSGTVVGILHSRNNTLADTVCSEDTSLLYGRDHFYEDVLGLSFCISPFSFFQTNTLGAEVLYQVVREFAMETKGKQIFDLYSGTGTIAQILAPVAAKVIGVEIVEEAVAAAKENAKRNGLTNCTFIAGDVLKVLDTIEEQPDLIILDPPRDGIHRKALDKIIAYGVPRIVYISCKPTSLQRDLIPFQAAGYRVEKIQAVDMFPHTANVETVALLCKA